MNKRSLMNLVNTVSKDHLKINRIRQSDSYIKDPKVLDRLCREAIETDNHRFREALIKTLKSNPDEANRRFSQVALCAKDPIHRRWALINDRSQSDGMSRRQRSRHARIEGYPSISSDRGGIQYGFIRRQRYGECL